MKAEARPSRFSHEDDRPEYQGRSSQRSSPKRGRGRRLAQCQVREEHLEAHATSKGVYLFTKVTRRGRKAKGVTDAIESRVEFEDGQKTIVEDTAGSAISNLVLETLKSGGQALVFARGRSEAIRLASSLGGPG